MYSDNAVKIIIHRGTHQIGGCCTEIATDTTRILIDFGANLNNEDNSVLDVDGVTNSKQLCNGILISHYHSDHIGELGLNNQNVPVYMTPKAIQIQELFQKHSKGQHMHNVSFCDIKPMHSGVAFSIGDIKILPIESEHSAFEPLMFFVEANGKRILHTGDFRMHGLHWSNIQHKLSQLPKLDLIITEGTTLSRTNEKGWTEAEVKTRLKDTLKNHKYCFFLTASSNISRIETFATSVPRGKYFLMDEFQRDLLKITDSNVFEKAYTYGKNLKLEQCGFGMIIRANNTFLQIIKKYLAFYPNGKIVLL